MNRLLLLAALFAAGCAEGERPAVSSLPAWVASPGALGAVGTASGPGVPLSQLVARADADARAEAGRRIEALVSAPAGSLTTVVATALERAAIHRDAGDGVVRVWVTVDPARQEALAVAVAQQLSPADPQQRSRLEQVLRSAR